MSASDFVKLGVPSVLAGALEDRIGTGWAMIGTTPEVRSSDPNAPELTLFRDGIYQYVYYNGQMSSSYANFDVPFDYAAGTPLYAAVHWTPGNATDTGNVRFGIEFTYSWAYGGPESPANHAFGPTQTVYTLASGHTNMEYHHHTKFFEYAIPGEIVQPNMRFLIRFFRDGAHELDTFDADVFVIGLDFYYQRNKFGQPNLTPPFI